MNGRTPLRVVKVGGSLLDSAGLGPRLQAWLDEEPHGHTVLLAGGGALVEAIRDLDRRHGLSEQAAHWLAIDAMSLTARVLAELLPAPREVICDFAELGRRAGGPGVSIFSAARFLREVEPTLPGTRLPCSWDVTSDSIAARLAIALSAERLVLLKASRPPPGAHLEQLAAAGYIDRFLPLLAQEAPPVELAALLS